MADSEIQILQEAINCYFDMIDITDMIDWWCKCEQPLN